MTFISLGSTCSIAYNLNINNLRFDAYPFDWTRTLNLNNVSRAIDTSFKDFLNLDKFKLKQFDESFEVNGIKGSYIYSNDYCSFFHDFNKLINEMDTTEFIQKYQRRINRFLELLRSNENITFIREEIGKLNKNKINKLIQSLNNYNPNMKFKIIIITNDHSYKNVNIEGVSFYFSDIRVTEWTRPEIDWNTLFIN